MNTPLSLKYNLGPDMGYGEISDLIGDLKRAAYSSPEDLSSIANLVEDLFHEIWQLRAELLEMEIDDETE